LVAKIGNSKDSEINVSIPFCSIRIFTGSNGVIQTVSFSSSNRWLWMHSGHSMDVGLEVFKNRKTGNIKI